MTKQKCRVRPRARQFAALALLPVVPLLLSAGCGAGREAAPEEAAAAGADPAPAAVGRTLPLPEGPLFVDVTEGSGVDFVHVNGMTGAYYMPENIGSGGALLDYDGDGDLDLYLVQGRPLGPDARMPARPLTDRLYRNDTRRGADGTPALRFTDVTAEAGLPPALYGMGAAAGDFDNDGRTDLYVTAFGPDRLLRNRGDGRFEDVTAASGAGDPRWTVPAVFFDYDGDGWLDLWVGSYLDFSFDDHRPCTTLTGAPDYCDPSAYRPLPDRLFRNRGAADGQDGARFQDVTGAAGLAGATGKALGALAADLDGDGRLDLYVANDGTPNHLWRNGGDGTFTDDALLAGCAVNAEGISEAGMGVDAGDYDGDGDDDLVVAHFTGETHTLYAADGSGGFVDATATSGLGAASLEANGFGAGWIDVDSDSLLDLLVVNGAVRAIEEQVRAGDRYPFRQRDQLFRNAGGRLEDVSDRAGPAFQTPTVGRGALFGDLDDDGDLDVVVTESAGPARVLQNVVGQERPWLGVRAVTETPTGAVRDALGARVGLFRPGRPPLWRRAAADGSFASARDPRALFGLGEGAPAPETVRVVWPDGSAEEWDAPAPGRYVTFRQGTGREVAR